MSALAQPCRDTQKCLTDDDARIHDSGIKFQSIAVDNRATTSHTSLFGGEDDVKSIPKKVH